MDIIEGRVTSVFTTGGSVFCNVSVLNTHNQDLQRVEVARPAGGFMATPAEGDAVLVSRLENGTEYITNVLSAPDIQFPALANDELTIRFGAEGELTISDTGAGYELQLDGVAVNLGTGGQGAITDIATTKDVDGHVTSVTLTRSGKVTIE